jgi:hypothetical protein
MPSSGSVRVGRDLRTILAAFPRLFHESQLYLGNPRHDDRLSSFRFQACPDACPTRAGPN